MEYFLLGSIKDELTKCGKTKDDCHLASHIWLANSYWFVYQSNLFFSCQSVNLNLWKERSNLGIKKKICFYLTCSQFDEYHWDHLKWNYFSQQLVSFSLTETWKLWQILVLCDLQQLPKLQNFSTGGKHLSWRLQGIPLQNCITWTYSCLGKTEPSYWRKYVPVKHGEVIIMTSESGDLLLVYWSSLSELFWNM